MLEVLCTNYSGNHPVVARTYDNIGSVLDDMGRFEEALELLHQSFDIKMSAHKKDDQDVAHRPVPWTGHWAGSPGRLSSPPVLSRCSELRAHDSGL